MNGWPGLGRNDLWRIPLRRPPRWIMRRRLRRGRRRIGRGHTQHSATRFTLCRLPGEFLAHLVVLVAIGASEGDHGIANITREESIPKRKVTPEITQTQTRTFCFAGFV